MNEGIEVFLNGGEKEGRKPEKLIRRIDSFLLDYGLAYSGVRNLYIPTEAVGRDHAVFAACDALKKADWLKDGLAYVSVMNQTDVCPLEQIRPDDMSEPSAAKLAYYEEYYRSSRELAHGIVVDEERKLRDGYISYLLAGKYGIRPDIYEALAGSPLRKVVKGRHAVQDGGTWRIKKGRRYSWTYSLKAPVVPGDILKVRTKKGQMYMCVEQIAYVTGEEFCDDYSAVIKHMKKRLKI